MGLSSSKSLLLFLVAVGSVFVLLLFFTSDLNPSSGQNSIVPCLPRPGPDFSEKVLLDFDEGNDLAQNILQIGKTGLGAESDWSIVEDEEAPSPPNVLAQTASEEVNFHFPYVIVATDRLRDVDVSVQFKAISGGIDQAAGIIFRFVDSNNYYVLRANALEDNLVLFKFVDGERPFIASASVEIPEGEWHSVRAVVVGECIQGYLDDTLLIETQDSSFKEGLVGLWTKADSVTYFDNLVIEY
ncbi:MAG: hypothetical protein O6762_03455 [Thaumarchaeota archaeon]|nr:hypothetical protein [Nitrososphaerota archaeon]